MRSARQRGHRTGGTGATAGVRAGCEAEAAAAAPLVAVKVNGPFWPQPDISTATVAHPAKHRVGSARSKGLAKLGIDTLTMRQILMSTPSAPFQTSGALSDADYQLQTQALLADLEAKADRWLQDDVIDIDTHRTGGMLELSFPNGSKLIINTQPPLQEVWLAARGGGFHYKWVGGAWRDTRDGSEFKQALSHHASLQAGKPLNF